MSIIKDKIKIHTHEGYGDILVPISAITPFVGNRIPLENEFSIKIENEVKDTFLTVLEAHPEFIDVIMKVHYIEGEDVLEGFKSNCKSIKVDWDGDIEIEDIKIIYNGLEYDNGSDIPDDPGRWSSFEFKIKISAGINSTAQTLESVLTLIGELVEEKIRLIQIGEEPYLYVDPLSITVGKDGISPLIYIESNDDWQIS